MVKKHKGRKPTEMDWICMRMLYLVLCGETSSALIRDVGKTIRYLEAKLGSNFYDSMSLIVAEHGRLGTFKNPASALARRLDKSIEYQDEINWPATEDIHGWKPRT